MKKVLLILLLIPINILAYSNKIIPGGDSIGLTIETEGITVVGFYKVNGKYIGSNILEVGDTILKINDVGINNVGDIKSIINGNSSVKLEILRNNRVIYKTLKLEMEDGVYKTGLYIKDKVSGIGTLTYIDPETNIYGALGHQITMNESNNLVKILSGNLYPSTIYSIDRSLDGLVGSKNARILLDNKIGSVLSNTYVGIYGNINNNYNKELMEIASFDDIKLGKAYILTTIRDNIEEFEIEITEINKKYINTNRSITFKVTDEDLLNVTGGIVQGMSGSPIVQNNKIIGAVTHVVVDEVDKGYGVYIETMLKEGDKIIIDNLY